MFRKITRTEKSNLLNAAASVTPVDASTELTNALFDGATVADVKAALKRIKLAFEAEFSRLEQALPK